MRYKKFIIENYSIENVKDENGVEGLNIIPSTLSELEQMENRKSIEVVESAYFTICELFEVEDVNIQFTHDKISFFLVNKDDGSIEEGVNSVWLSRELIKKAEPKEISGAIIDLILHRKEWSEVASYRNFL